MTRYYLVLGSRNCPQRCAPNVNDSNKACKVMHASLLLIAQVMTVHVGTLLWGTRRMLVFMLWLGNEREMTWTATRSVLSEHPTKYLIAEV